MASTRACAFTLDGHRFAVDVAEAREVVVFEEVTPLPLAPSFVLGLSNLRGTVMPVVDLAPMLGLPPREAKGQTLGVVLGHGPWTAAAVVDSVLGLEPLQAPDGDGAAAPTGGGRFTAAGAAGADGSITVLDAGAMLTALRGAMGAARAGTTSRQGGR
jgi:purine-binding chemotaxis protein CheW